MRCSRDQIPCVYATNRPSASTQETDAKDERWVSEVFSIVIVYLLILFLEQVLDSKQWTGN